MSRLGPGARTVVATLIAVLLVGGGLVQPARAVQVAVRSNVILVLDFSASILQDEANRMRFAAALERIAARVDETSADLTVSDARISIVQFATLAADVPGCVDLKFLNSDEAVGQFADCLRSVAGAYRTGAAPAGTKAIGVDTNYVAAMERANAHLPRRAARPTVILFTDGKHDVAGVPVSQVQPARERLFGARTPFALLPVGMGLDPASREALAAGLDGLKVIRDMDACVSGEVFDWPTAVFDSPDEAGNAVAIALQDATCSFTAPPVPGATPPLTGPGAIGAVQGIRLSAHDGGIDVAWSSAPATNTPIVDYNVRCRAGDGDWIESDEGVSTEPETVVDGLANGTTYECEVAAVGPNGPGAWTAAGSITPFGRPAAPGKPTVKPLNRAVVVEIPADDTAEVSSYRIECSPDNGATWPVTSDVSPDSPTAQIGQLANGVDYRCRAFAANAVGISDASPLSDLIRPCGSALECNPVLLPVVGGLALLFAVGLLAAFIALYRGRTTGYVVAVVDIVHTANIGHGSNLGIAFVREPQTRRVTGIVAERGKLTDVRIRRLRDGRFAVKDRSGGRRIVPDGEAIVVADATGGRHSLVLQAFATTPASQVASRR